MRVMFLLNCLGTGGAELHTYQVANSLAGQGDICTIVSLTSSYSAADLSQNSIKTAHLSPSSVKTAHLSRSSVEMLNGNRISDIGTMLSVMRLIRAFSPHVIIAIEERPLLFAAIARQLAGSNAKLVSILHRAYLQTTRDRLLHPIHRHIVGRVDAVIYVSQNQRKLWEDRGFSPPRSVVIRNGVDLHRFSDHSVIEWRDRTRLQLGFAPDDYVIGMCAHFRPEKNHCQLIDAVRVLRDRGHPAKALLVGNGPTQATVAQYARENGLLEHIVFAGHQNEVRPYTSAFDVGVLCSLYESAPLVVLEMMAMGLPVIVSNVGGTGEMVLPGETGFLFPAGDTVSLVRCLQTLSEPRKRETVGRAASQFVASNFAAERMLDSYRGFLTGLLVENRR